MIAITRLALLMCAAVALTFLPACESDGHLNLLGYTTRPNYDCSIRTVRVPIFQNRTFARGLEFELTRAVVRAIELQTPYKVVGADADADTELSGTIISFTKNTLNVNPLNEIREQETNLVVELSWRNLRTGQILSDPKRNPDAVNGPALPALPGAVPVTVAPGVVLPGAASAPTAPGSVVAVAPENTPAVGPACNAPVPASGKITIASTGNFIPELGQSLTTAQKQNVDRLAVQIVSMMEKSW